MKSTKTCPSTRLSSRAAAESGASTTSVWNSGCVRLKLMQTSISSWMASVKLKAPSESIARSASAISRAYVEASALAMASLLGKNW